MGDAMQDLRERHKRLRTLLRELCAILDLAEPQIDELSRVRTQIASLVREQFVQESLLLAQLKSGDPTHPADQMIDQYQHRIRTAYLAYSEIIGQWTPQRIRAEWPAYQVVAHAQIAKCVTFLDWVEDGLYNKLEALQSPPAPLRAAARG
jgi:hypothetical protein